MIQAHLTNDIWTDDGSEVKAGTRVIVIEYQGPDAIVEVAISDPSLVGDHRYELANVPIRELRYV